MFVFFFLIALLLLPILYNLFFPVKRPKLENYFKGGEKFSSESEGLSQTVIKQEGNKVFCEVKLNPFAAGPPEHLHENMDECATVIKGILTAKIGGEIRKIHAGERVIFKRGIYHKMYNETDEEVILRSEQAEDYLPVEFAYSLAQIYPLMHGSNNGGFKVFARICMLDDLFDMVPAGPPPMLFKGIKKIIKPYARLLGTTRV